MSQTKTIKRAVIVGALALSLSGCTYDYFQNTDRVAHGAGDAVKANLERETIDPADGSANSTKGLGKNGVAAPPPPTS